ncbi:neuropilin and tolloid 1 [Labeo rohita]|uniref:Mitochondrial import inner membrane translocase subunit TIM21 n=1 Tax=Labeo rohita TaxID=84645 RepID=A0A498LP79_LABRO|nr:neuropilin and tolloid 1 [Labeo rohita]
MAFHFCNLSSYVAPTTVCEFEMGGPEGIVESQQITKDGKALQTEAVDCKWYIRAPPRSKRSVVKANTVYQIYLRFLDYEMQNSNECKRNFVAVYDGSSSVEDLRNKFCSTVANDVMLVSALGVVRMWADEGSRKSRFRILFTTFQEPPCEADTFFCHSNMCINNTLVCNGIQNCVYPWDENHCKEKRKANILDNLNNTNGTIIGVTCCIVLILLVVSVIVQIKQPRKKYILRREDFDPTMFQEVFQEPPHYELCTLRSAAATSADLAELAEDFESYHKLRRASSRCVHEHHCGSSQLSSNKGSRTNLSPREATAAILTDLPPQPMRPLPPQTNRRNILVMRHTYSQDAADACDLDDDLEEVPTTSHRLSRHEKAVQRCCCLGQMMDNRVHFCSKNNGQKDTDQVSVSRSSRSPPSPSATQKVKQAGKDFTYLIVVLIGLGVTGGLLYVVFQELFSSSSPSKIYGKAFERCRSHPEVIGVFGEPIKGYGETSRRGRRQQVSHVEYIKDGLKYMRLKFYIEGSEPGLRGTVHSESKENPETGKYEFRYIFVDIDTVVIIFIMIKIFFYICWYRSRQRQLAAYLSNPRNAQIVIVGGRAYLHQICERQNTSIWPNWYGVQDDGSVGEPSASLPPSSSLSHLDMPPPYEAVSGANDLKPPPYSEYAQNDDTDASLSIAIPDSNDSSGISDAPPPYTPSVTSPTNQQADSNSQSQLEGRSS